MCADTKPNNVKSCSSCNETKELDLFIKKRNICKVCMNDRKKELRIIFNSICSVNEGTKICNICNFEHTMDNYSFNRKTCIDCRNTKRRDNYKTNDILKQKCIQNATNYKKNKTLINNEIKIKEKEELEENIGSENTICKYCEKIKNKSRFRYNRLKCRDCERDDPISRILRNSRVRIMSCLKTKNHHLIEYLGCNGNDYYKWLKYSNDNFEIKNSSWHIDHVIPLSKFELLNEEEQLIALNWRNTMPLPAKENLSKNNKIIKEQIIAHIKCLEKYHKENNIEFPENFKVLFAKHLVVRGSP